MPKTTSLVDRSRRQGDAGGKLCRSYIRPESQGCHEAGLLFGAYHFGTGANGVSQAQHFLSVLKPDNKTVVVLDFEDNSTGTNMTLEEARAFVTHVKQATGRWPGFYSGHTIKRLLGSAVDPILANCWFWLAQYGPTAVVPRCWPTWTLWQYTDGGVGPEPHEVAGIGRCDRNFFKGTQTQLKQWWGSEA